MTETPWRQMTEEQVKHNIDLGKALISILEQTNDPDKQKVRDVLQGQIDLLERELIARAEGKPGPQVVGLKTLTLKVSRG